MTKFVIEGRLPGLNEYTAACRSNKYAGAKMKKESQQLVETAIIRYIPRVRFDGPVQIVFAWHEPNRRRDLDNICFAKKFILDAMVSMGIITTDSRKGVGQFFDIFEVDKKNPRIEVEIQEVEK